LQLLIELAESHREIPASVTELYDRFSDQVLGRFDKDKGIEVLFEYFIKKRFLANLAFNEFFGKDRLSIPRDELDQYLVDYAALYGWEPSRLDLFVLEVERSGVLEVRDTVEFSHRSFLDFYVAYYLFENREVIDDLDTCVADAFFNDVWSDVAFYYIGLRR